MTCAVAVGCHPGWDAASRATALLIHTDEAGDSGACTGVLLNDADPATRIPYLLTAYHCVADQTRASSLEAYFFHRARSCGGPLEPPQAVRGGADLLDAAAPTDTSFLRLRAPPPAGAVFLGWSAALPPIGTAVAGIHHPRGAPQQIAFGTVTGRRHCAEVGACAGGTAAGGEHLLEVTWSPGDTAPGSSGAGLLLADTRVLVGTLFGGVSGWSASPTTGASISRTGNGCTAGSVRPRARRAMVRNEAGRARCPGRTGRRSVAGPAVPRALREGLLRGELTPNRTHPLDPRGRRPACRPALTAATLIERAEGTGRGEAAGARRQIDDRAARTGAQARGAQREVVGNDPRGVDIERGLPAGELAVEVVDRDQRVRAGRLVAVGPGVVGVERGEEPRLDLLTAGLQPHPAVTGELTTGGARAVDLPVQHAQTPAGETGGLVHDRDPRPTAQERRGERELLELSADVHGAPLAVRGRRKV